ncbi:MAG: hypothetical protein DWH79_02320 [Planctomycetota bacterium]|nr:MAG: hypothetical protein DWH79_02320 [Planctomycetota bacterium]
MPFMPVMSAPFSIPTLRNSLTLFAAVAMALAFWAGGVTPAQASCGDWLVGHDVTAAGVDGQSIPLQRATDSQHSPPARRPCSGPSCSRAPLAPLAPTDAPVLRFDIERSAHLVAIATVEDFQQRLDRPADDTLLPSAVPGRLDRPPRGV